MHFVRHISSQGGVSYWELCSTFFMSKLCLVIQGQWNGLACDMYGWEEKCIQVLTNGIPLCFCNLIYQRMIHSTQLLLYYKKKDGRICKCHNNTGTIKFKFIQELFVKNISECSLILGFLVCYNILYTMLTLQNDKLPHCIVIFSWNLWMNLISRKVQTASFFNSRTFEFSLPLNSKN